MKTLSAKEKYVSDNWLIKTNSEIGKAIGVGIRRVSTIARKLGLPNKTILAQKPIKETTVSIQDKIVSDRNEKKTLKKSKETKEKYDFLLSENERLQEELDASLMVKEHISPVVYNYNPITNDTESIAIVLASDWHYEENVRPETINGLNEFTTTIAKERIEKFFKTTLKFIEIERNATSIDTLVLALLGDFISGNIHEELLQNCSLPPIDAMIEVENQIIGGIQYLLDNSDLKIIIPCHSGNHSRLTKRIFISSEAGNSLEAIMYHHIKNHFSKNERVDVKISRGYLSYINLWGFTVCFSHGHAVKFAGGVGGITIPLRKAISQWQKTRRADLYVCGHWHNALDIGEAVINGSLIGYSAFSLFIKAEYEKPKQVFLIVNKKYNEKVLVRSIILD